jgi:hypothetical protein
MNSKFKIIIASVLLVFVLDQIAVGSLASELQDTDDYEQVCVMDKLSDGLSTNILIRKVERELSIERSGVYKYLYAERAIRKAMDKC